MQLFLLRKKCSTYLCTLQVSRYELLIENFMDPAHVTYAHYGLFQIITIKASGMDFFRQYEFVISMINN